MEKIERRKESRISKKGVFQFNIAENNQASQLTKEGFLVDYSPAGIRFVTDTQLDKNIELLIRLDLDSFNDDGVDWRKLWETGNATYLNVIGSVMWCLSCDGEPGKFEVGTRFSHKVEK